MFYFSIRRPTVSRLLKRQHVLMLLGWVTVINNFCQKTKITQCCWPMTALRTAYNTGIFQVIHKWNFDVDISERNLFVWHTFWRIRNSVCMVDEEQNRLLTGPRIFSSKRRHIRRGKSVQGSSNVSTSRRSIIDSTGLMHPYLQDYAYNFARKIWSTKHTYVVNSAFLWLPLLEFPFKRKKEHSYLTRVFCNVVQTIWLFTVHSHIASLWVVQYSTKDRNRLAYIKVWAYETGKLRQISLHMRFS